MKTVLFLVVLVMLNGCVVYGGHGRGNGSTTATGTIGITSTTTRTYNSNGTTSGSSQIGANGGITANRKY
jgi:hypothetical protein